MKLGILAIGAALLNYRKAKKELEDLEEYRDGVQAAIDTYNFEKDEKKYEHDIVDTKPNDLPSGLKVSTILRVGNLVGQLMRVQTSVVMTNTSDREIRIKSVAAECKLLDELVKVYKINVVYKDYEERPQSVTVDAVIQPGETREFKLPCGISGLGDKMGELRAMICEAANKRLITSCPKISIEGGQIADIRCTWDDNGTTKQFYILGKPGVLRYCMEAFYPTD